VTEPTVPAVSMPSVAKPLRIMSLVEASSYLVLLGAVVAKRAFDAPGEGGVPIMGPLHGTLYLVFAVLALIGREEQGWSAKETVLALVLGAIPLGGFYVERKMIEVPAKAA
jgi:integral membrane protein